MLYVKNIGGVGISFDELFDCSDTIGIFVLLFVY